MLARVLPIAVAAVTLGTAGALALGAAGCEKLDHEAIDRWSHTTRGPEKLLRAVSSDRADPDLAAHAAANLAKRDDNRGVCPALAGLPAARRAQIVTRLAPRMWDVARVE